MTTAPVPVTEAQILDAVETFPAPAGFSWAVVNDRLYCQACKDGLPTLYLEYKSDDDIVMVYLVGQHEIAPEVTR